ncbi:MAG: hypothetical protein NTV51_18570 [Verrucomicrobia bacterium]|nr:hypothetical protein [Verrucomicrobiota bacterium]
MKLTQLVAVACALATGPAFAAAPSPAAAADVASAQWSDIKDCTHEMRAQFSAGLSRLEAQLDAQVRELVAKRRTMKGITDTREWDFAMKELESARSYLHAVGLELAKASRETWDQEKDKVGRAWVSTQDAYGKVKRSTTS